MARLNKYIFILLMVSGISFKSYPQTERLQNQIVEILNSVNQKAAIDSSAFRKFLEIKNGILNLKESLNDEAILIFGECEYLNGDYEPALKLFSYLNEIPFNDYFIIQSFANLPIEKRNILLKEYPQKNRLIIETLVDLLLKLETGKINEAEKIFEFAESQFRSNKTLSYYYLKISLLSWKMNGNLEDVFYKAESEIKTIKEKAILLINKAENYLKLNKFKLAYYNLNKVKSEVKDDLFLNTKLNYLFALFYSKVSEHDKAYFYIENHRKFSLLFSNENEKLKNSLLLISVLYELNRFKVANVELKKVSDLIKSSPSVELKRKYHELALLINLQFNDTGKALQNLNILENLSYDRNELNYLYAMFYLKSGKIKRAYQTVKKINILENEKNVFRNEKYLKLYLEILKKLTINDELLNITDKYIEAKEKKNNKLFDKKIKEIETLKKIENLEAKNIILKQTALINKNNERKMRLFLYAIIFVAILSISYLYFLIKLKNNANEKALIQNEEIKTLNAQLIEKNENLEKVIKDRDKLLSVLAHDLRNPVNTIIRITETFLVAQKSLSQAEEKKYKENILKLTKSASNILENLLEWRKANNNEIKLRNLNVKLDSLLEEVINELKPFADSKSVEIKFESYFNETVMIDPDLISSVVRNLIVNAIKYSPVGKSVKVTSNKEDSKFVIMIIDEGKGINKNILKKLFSNEITHPEKGTENEGGLGLGLKLCKEFVEMHNGEIFAKNGRKGAIFYFKIPIVQFF